MNLNLKEPSFAFTFLMTKEDLLNYNLAASKVTDYRIYKNQITVVFMAAMLMPFISYNPSNKSTIITTCASILIIALFLVFLESDYFKRKMIENRINSEYEKKRGQIISQTFRISKTGITKKDEKTEFNMPYDMLYSICESQNMFLFMSGHDNILASVPKRVVPKEDLEEIRKIFKENMREKYFLV